MYTERDQYKLKIGMLKYKLRSTDYQAIKFAEGEISLEEYAPVRDQRRAWRAEINAIEAQIKALEFAAKASRKEE